MMSFTAMAPAKQYELGLADICEAFDNQVKLNSHLGAKELESLSDFELHKLRVDGDEKLTARDFVGAVKAYSKCIAQIPATIAKSEDCRATLQAAYASRSECWLYLQKWENALIDAKRALEVDPSHVRTLYCMGKALHGLEKYDLAVAAFNAALSRSPQDSSTIDAHAKSRTALKQSEEGVYDLSAFLLGGCLGSVPSCSDFVGPIEIQYVPYAQRGLVASKDVVAGTLLLVSNAMAVSCSPTEFWVESRISKANYDILIAQLSSQIKSSRRSMSQLYSLASNSNEHMSIPPMDMFMPGRDLDWNEFVDEIDRQRIGGIVRYNAFDAIKCTDPIPFGEIETEFNTGSGTGINAFGIWPLPSFLNHSCAKNCNTMFIGNAMFVRASRDIAAGEQLTIMYCDPYEPLEYRQDSLKWWKFQCKCDRCELEQTMQQPLEKLFVQHRRMVDNGLVKEITNIVPQVERLISEFACDLDETMQNWLRAPFIEAYTACILVHMDSDDEKIKAIHRALAIMRAVQGSDLAALQLSSTLLRDVKRKHGEESDEYKATEEMVLDTVRATLGDYDKQFSLALIDARLNASNQAFG